jgi:hypothetical protein
MFKPQITKKCRDLDTTLDMYRVYDVRPTQPLSKIAGSLEHDFVLADAKKRVFMSK